MVSDAYCVGHLRTPCSLRRLLSRRSARSPDRSSDVLLSGVGDSENRVLRQINAAGFAITGDASDPKNDFKAGGGAQVKGCRALTIHLQARDQAIPAGMLLLIESYPWWSPSPWRRPILWRQDVRPRSTFTWFLNAAPRASPTTFGIPEPPVPGTSVIGHGGGNEFELGASRQNVAARGPVPTQAGQ